MPGKSSLQERNSELVELLRSEFAPRKTGSYPGSYSPYNVMNYGAVGDGVHDDTPNIQACLTTNHLAYLPKPSVGWYLSGAGISLDATERIWGDWMYLSKIIVAGTLGIYVNGDNWGIENLSIYPSAGNDYLFDGILVEGTIATSSNGGHLENIHINHADKALRVKGKCYFNKFNHIYAAVTKTNGIVLEIDATAVYYPNANKFELRQLTGNRVAGSIGIDAHGDTNVFCNGEINNFEIGVQNTGLNPGQGMNRFIDIYSENNYATGGSGDYALHAVSGVTFWHNLSAASRIRKEAGAVVLTPHGGYGPSNDVAPLNLPLRDCTGLYLFKEGTGTDIADSLHTAHVATIAGGGTWVNGLSYYGVECDSTAGQYIDIPIDVIDPEAIYSCIVVWKPVSLSAAYSYNDIIMFNKTNDNHRVYVAGPDAATYTHRMVAGPATTRGVNSPHQEVDDFSILAFCYDPTLGKIYMRHPYAYTWTQDYSLVNQLTNTLTSIRLNGTNTHAHTIQYSLAAFWQRDISYEESLSFCNAIPLLTLIG